MWGLIEQGQVDILNLRQPPREVIEGAQSDLREFLKVHPSPSLAIDEMHAANVARDIAIGAMFRLEWQAAIQLLVTRQSLLQQPKWADYSTSHLRHHPKNSGRDLFNGAMHHLALSAHRELCKKDALPVPLVAQMFMSIDKHQQALAKLTDAERDLIGASIARRECRSYEMASQTLPNNGQRLLTNRVLMQTIQDGFSEQTENVRILLEAFLQPFARVEAANETSWNNVKASISSHWGPLALPIGAKRDAFFEFFGIPRQIQNGGELELRPRASRTKAQWPDATQNELARRRGICPAYPALRGAPPIDQGAHELMTRKGVRVKDSIATGRLLLFAGTEFVPLLGKDFSGLSHLQDGIDCDERDAVLNIDHGR